jgi:hypothetical protein
MFLLFNSARRHFVDGFTFESWRIGPLEAKFTHLRRITQVPVWQVCVYLWWHAVVEILLAGAECLNGRVD